MNDYISIAQAAKQFKTHRQTLYSAAKIGALKVDTIAGRPLTTRSWVQEWIDKGCHKPGRKSRQSP